MSLDLLYILIPFITYISFYLSCIIEFSHLSRGIFHNYISLITLKTDWKNSFLEDLAEETRNYFNAPFISITKLITADTGRMIISSGDNKAGYLMDSVVKEEYHLQKRRKKILPFIYKTEDTLIHRNQNNQNIFKSYNLKYSFMIPFYFSDRKEEAFMSLYFDNQIIYYIAYFKYILIKTKLSYFYAGIFRNICMAFENSAELLLEEIEDYVAISLDEEANIVAWNKGAERLFGYRSIEIIGQRFSVFFNFGEEDTFDKSLEILEVKKDVKFFATLKDRMNIPIKVELKIKKLLNVTNELAGFSVFVKDITKEEIFKDNIRQHSFINYTILENSQDGILILDENDKIIFYNQRVRIILDNSMNLFGVPGKKIFPRRFGEEFEKAINILKQPSIEFLDIDYCFEQKYYNIRFFRVHKNLNNEYGGVIVFFIDESIKMLTLLELEEKKEALEKINLNLLDALTSAKVIQENLIPQKLPNNDKIRCVAIYELSDDLGGDFYYIDNIFIADQEYGIIFISDVSGHGISSSMMNVMVKDVYGTFRDNLLTGDPIEPDLFLKLLNKKILELNIAENKFITCFIAIIDYTDRKIKMCSAGHTLPYFMDINKVELLSFRRAVPLGIIDKLELVTEEISYKKDDQFICYTDGFLDLFETDDQKPSDSATQFLKDNKDKELEVLKEKILDRNIRFKKDQFSSYDDLTVVIFRLG